MKFLEHKICFVYKIHNMSNYSKRLVLPYIITERCLTYHVLACLYVTVLHDEPVPIKISHFAGR